MELYTTIHDATAQPPFRPSTLLLFRRKTCVGGIGSTRALLNVPGRHTKYAAMYGHAQ
jgi:hypothetical protein